MNIPLSFSEQGAHFRIGDSEYQILDTIAREDEQTSLRELPIGKAATLLKAIPMGAAYIKGGIAIDARTQKTVIDPEMDGQEAMANLIINQYGEKLSHAVRDIGRVTVTVIKDTEIDQPNAIPVFNFEILSRAHIWGKKVVDIHKDSLYSNGNINPGFTQTVTNRNAGASRNYVSASGFVFKS